MEATYYLTPYGDLEVERYATPDCVPHTVEILTDAGSAYELVEHGVARSLSDCPADVQRWAQAQVDAERLDTGRCHHGNACDCG